MRIFIDIDDTITNFGGVLLKNLNEKYNTNYKISDIINWDWIKEKFEEPWSVLTPWFWREVKVDNKAKNFIERRIMQGDEIYLATATFIDEALPVKIETTLKQLDNIIDKDHVIITRNKNILCGDMMIDDGLHNLIDNNCKYNVCFSQPWNYSLITRTENECLEILRTSSWNTIYNYIELLKQYKMI